MSAPRVKYVPLEERKGDSHQLPRGLRREMLERDGGICQVCHKKGNHVTHRIPISRGGETVAWNLAVYCESCCHAKDDLLPEEFVRTSYVKDLFAPDLLGDNPINVVVAFLDGTYLKGKMREHPITRKTDWIIVVGGVEMLLPREQVKGIAILPQNKQIKVDIAGYLKRISS